MKTLARFIYFFGSWFPAIFIIAAGSVFLSVWIGAASRVPPDSSITIRHIAERGLWIVPFTMYMTLVLSINYGHRRDLAMPLLFIFAVLLANAFIFGASKGLSIAAKMETPPIAVKHGLIGRIGLMLSRPGTTITLLDRPSNTNGSRIVAIDGRPLIYQKTPRGADGKIIPLPPVPFRQDRTWLYDSISSDFSISGQRLAARFEEGYIAFFSWTLTLSILLVSLAFVFEMTSWPLANFFLGLLVFRGILAFEVFLTSDEIMGYLHDFVRGAIPDIFIVPAIFAAVALLILIYTFLFHFARKVHVRVTLGRSADGISNLGGGGDKGIKSG